MAPAASIVVPTLARPDYLAVTLRSLAPQAREHGAEIIVVDDGGLAASAQVAAASGAVYVRHDHPQGPNAARNTGIEHAQGDLIVLVDDDIEAAPGWLDALLRGADALPDHDVFGGPIRPRLEGHELRECAGDAPPVTALDLGPEDCEAEFVWSANMAIRRGALERVGTFDAELEIYGDEEEWQRRFHAAGGRTRYLAGAAVDHRRAGRDATLRALARAQYMRGRHSRRFDERKGTAPGLGRELRTLAGCCWHLAARRCGGGVLMAAHSAGRVREALAR